MNDMPKLPHGFNMRDYFAGQVLPAIFAQSAADFSWGQYQPSPTLPELAERAYRVADAMLDARMIARKPQKR